MMSLQQAIAQYRLFALAEGRSPRTIEWVTRSVGYFGLYLGEKQDDITKITADDLRSFIIACGKRTRYLKHPYSKPGPVPMSQITVQTYTRAIRSFFSFLAAEELIPENTMRKVRPPRVAVKAVPTFNQEEVERLLSAPDRKTASGFRDFAILLTFLDTNIRLSELLNLDEKDVDLENGYLRIMGKGGKERVAPIGHNLLRALSKYKMKYRPHPLGCEAFWLGEDGRRPTPNRVKSLVRKYAKQVGLVRCYPHKLRHTASVLYLRNGGDVFSLQKKLGHSSLLMTRHYCNLADTDVKDKHMKFGVGDRLKISVR
jgi:site-specific recombinase XerD